MWLMILKNAAGPVIGAVIGYFTNLVAVKMLFYPRKPVKLFGHVLPFTPGVIPKGKPRLARAIGRAVGENLLTKDDIQNKILSDSVIENLSESVVKKLGLPVHQLVTGLTDLPDAMYENGKEKIASALGGEIVAELGKIDFASLIVQKVAPVIMDSIRNPMIKMFITKDFIASLAQPADDEIKRLLETEGGDFIRKMIRNRIDEADKKSVAELLRKVDVQEMMLRSITDSLFRKIISEGSGKILDSINISEIVESKINDMDIDELEKLILGVMKKELNTIVNLGALIGLVLGLINLLVQHI